MRLILFCSILLLSNSLFANSDSILSKTKQDIIKNEKKQNEKSSDILKFDWVNPINASYSHSTNDATSPSQKNYDFSVSLNQPIFKSGGIYYAIKYAGANRNFLDLSTQTKERSLIIKAYTALLSLKSIDLKIKKQKLLIDNADIDIKRKKEEYLGGVLDSSFLDNAILKKNSLEIALLDLMSQRADLVKTFKSISDKDYKTFKLPQIKLVKLQNFLKNNLYIKSAVSNSLQNYYLKKMTISNYLPTVSLFAGYYKNKTDYLTTFKEEHKRYGITVSMPIFDINRAKNIELQRLKYIKSKLDTLDKKRFENEFYSSMIKKIKIYKKKISLAKEQIRLYKSLLNTTKDLFNGGEKTLLDVKTMENSLKSSKIDIYIYKNDINKILFEIFEHLDFRI